MRRSIVFALICIPAIAVAQSRGTISPGMNRSQVVAALGEPATSRTVSEYSYLFYANACGTACGMNDLVILRSDSVVDAIFRSPERHYTGVSSSPTPRLAQTSSKKKRKPLAVRKDAADSAKATKSTDKAAPAATKGDDKASKPVTQIKTPKEANDARPSIPANPPKMKPAPATAPATKKPAEST